MTELKPIRFDIVDGLNLDDGGYVYECDQGGNRSGEYYRAENVREAMAGKWLPIQTAPKDGKVLLFFADGEQAVGFSDQIQYAGDGNGGLAMVKATHWMPLPSPPRQEAESE